jgi:hypothetical protein
MGHHDALQREEEEERQEEIQGWRDFYFEQKQMYLPEQHRRQVEILESQLHGESML